MRVKKEPWIIGNWKMHKTHEEAAAFVASLLETSAGKLSLKKVGLAPPFTSIASTMRAVLGTGIRVGAQNMHAATEGAFTGEISARMLLALGVTFVLIGHSERRCLFGETDFQVNQKVKAALAAGLMPIVCIGETEAEKLAGNTAQVLKRQMIEGLAGLSSADIIRIGIAYEPIWAIGTGQSATPELAQLTHRECRRLLSGLSDERSAGEVPILYGGSVKPENIKAFIEEEEVDGVLVGGASLDPKLFGEML